MRAEGNTWEVDAAQEIAADRLVPSAQQNVDTCQSGLRLATGNSQNKTLFIARDRRSTRGRCLRLLQTT